MKSKIILLILGLALCGCSDFLEESSQDEVRPSTINDMNELMEGESYPAMYEAFFDLTEIFTDDMICNGYDPTCETSLQDVEAGRWRYGWQREMFEKSGGGAITNYWDYPYSKIKGCNLILDYVEGVSGDPVKKENLRGEAMVMRGYYYLILVNMFAQPYNAGNPATNLGVPLKLRLGVTEDFFPRNTVAEVYSRIEKDLLEGNRLMEENKQPKKHFSRMNDLGAKAILSRMYLYMENWDKALEYADKVLAEKPALLKLSLLGNLGAPAWGEGVYTTATPDEIIWSRPTGRSVGSGWRYRLGYGISPDLTGLYERGEDGTLDLRYKLYFMKEWSDLEGDYVPGIICKDRDNSSDGIRTAEMYLNRAECYIHKYIETGKEEFRKNALADLNHLREYRYDTRNMAYQPVEITDKEELLNFCKDERRRELCVENNHRWFDLRRYGMPELTHVYWVVWGEEQTYTLEEKSPRYVLPIPELVLEHNPQLLQNP